MNRVDDLDRDEAFARARELHDDHPHLTADVILAALDDEYVGSDFYPSGSAEFAGRVARMVTS